MAAKMMRELSKGMPSSINKQVVDNKERDGENGDNEENANGDNTGNSN
jgi:hypothetical protein